MAKTRELIIPVLDDIMSDFDRYYIRHPTADGKKPEPYLLLSEHDFCRLRIEARSAFVQQVHDEYNMKAQEFNGYKILRTSKRVEPQMVIKCPSYTERGRSVNIKIEGSLWPTQSAMKQFAKAVGEIDPEKYELDPPNIRPDRQNNLAKYPTDKNFLEMVDKEKKAKTTEIISGGHRGGKTAKIQQHRDEIKKSISNRFRSILDKTKNKVPKQPPWWVRMLKLKHKKKHEDNYDK